MDIALNNCAVSPDLAYIFKALINGNFYDFHQYSVKCGLFYSWDEFLKCLKTKRIALSKLDKCSTDAGIALCIFQLAVIITIYLFINPCPDNLLNRWSVAPAKIANVIIAGNIKFKNTVNFNTKSLNIFMVKAIFNSRTRYKEVFILPNINTWSSNILYITDRPELFRRDSN